MSFLLVKYQTETGVETTLSFTLYHNESRESDFDKFCFDFTPSKLF